jgi:hypothetical protein
MPVSVTALACEGERGMVNGDVGRGWGKRVWESACSAIGPPYFCPNAIS